MLLSWHHPLFRSGDGNPVGSFHWCLEVVKYQRHLSLFGRDDENIAERSSLFSYADGSARCRTLFIIE